MLLYILLSVIVIGFTITYFINRTIQQVNKVFNQELKHLDKTYNQYVSQKLPLLPKDNFELNIDLLKQSSYEHLEPHLLQLLDYINTTSHPNNTLYQCTSQYFPNLISLAEELFRNKKLTPNHLITSKDKHEFKKAAQDAIEADIDKRVLELKVKK